MKANIDLIMVCAGSQGPSDKMHVPLGLIYVGSELERHGYNVKIWHLMGEELEEALPEIRSRDPLWIGLSVLTGMTTFQAVVYSRRIREELPRTPIVWGGHHPTAAPVECLRESYVDYVICGEGEDVAVELADALLNGDKDLSGIDNIGYLRPDGQVVVNPLRTLEKDLDRYELNWDLLDLNDYIDPNSSGKRSISFYSSRGCPFDCTFCTTPTYTGKKFRSHSPEFVEQCFRYLHDTFGFNSVYFADDNFLINRKRGFDIIRRLGKIGVSVDTLDVRLNQLNDQVMGMFRELGVSGIFFGWESGNERILELMKKGITLAQMKEKFPLFRKYGINCWASSIIGLPTETRQEVYNTLDFSMWLRDVLPEKSTVSTYRYMPLPATPLFHLAVSEGFPVPRHQEDWGKIDPIGPNFEMPWLPWLTEDDRRFFAYSQELSRCGMLDRISGRSPPAQAVYNYFVDRMRSKVQDRRPQPDWEYYLFEKLRNTALKISGKRPAITSQALSEEKAVVCPPDAVRPH